MDGTQINEQPQNEPDTNDSAPQSTPVEDKKRERVVNLHFANGVITVGHTAHDSPLAHFDISPLLEQPIGRDLAAYGAGQLLRQAASDQDDPRGAVQAMIDRLHKGDWRPGRKAIVTETEPVIEALAQHLGKPAAWIVEKYLPAYCQQQKLMTSNGRVMGSAAKAELAKHPDIAPIVTRIITQRAKANRNTASPDLAAIAAE